MNQKSIERKQMRPRTRSRIVCLKAVLRVAALASEGGASTYTPGTYGDFGMNILPKGLSIRENIAYTYGKIEQFPAVIPNTAIPVTPELKDKVWFSLLQVIYSTDFKILGGRYFADINIPVDFNLKVETHLGPLSEESEDSGLDDIRVVPFGLLWDRGNFHFLAAENIIVPTAVTMNGPKRPTWAAITGHSILFSD
jgi:hypothetical protein